MRICWTQRTTHFIDKLSLQILLYWLELIPPQLEWYHLLHTHPFNGPFSGTTWVSQYQKGKTNLDFTEARDSEWQWHQLGHMQVCTSVQTDNHASTPPLSFYRLDALPAAQPTASKHWRDTTFYNNHIIPKSPFFAVVRLFCPFSETAMCAFHRCRGHKRCVRSFLTATITTAVRTCCQRSRPVRRSNPHCSSSTPVPAARSSRHGFDNSDGCLAPATIDIECLQCFDTVGWASGRASGP